MRDTHSAMHAGGAPVPRLRTKQSVQCGLATKMTRAARSLRSVPDQATACWRVCVPVWCRSMAMPGASTVQRDRTSGRLPFSTRPKLGNSMGRFSSSQARLPRVYTVQVPHARRRHAPSPPNYISCGKRSFRRVTPSAHFWLERCACGASSRQLSNFRSSTVFHKAEARK